MNIIAKIKTLDKKRLLTITAVVVILLVAGWWISRADNSQLSDEQITENKNIMDMMNKARISGGLDSTRLANIEASKKAGKYAEALQQLNAILAEPNLTENDKRTLYSVLSSLCIPLNDFECADKVIAEYGKLLPYDYYFIVDVARLANTSKQPVKAEAYFTMVLTELDKQGGQSYVDKLNESSETSLDYAEIKKGSGQ